MTEETYNFHGTTLYVAMNLVGEFGGKLGFEIENIDKTNVQGPVTLRKGECKVIVSHAPIKGFCYCCDEPESVQEIQYVGDTETLKEIKEVLPPYDGPLTYRKPSIMAPPLDREVEIFR